MNSIGALVVIGLIFYWGLTWMDAYWLLSKTILFYIIMGNILYFAVKRRIKKWASILLELALFIVMIYIGNSITYFLNSLLCTIECFGVDIVFFSTLLFIVTFLVFSGCFLYTTKGKQRIIGSAIILFLIWLFIYSPVSYWYRENFLITRFPVSQYYYKDKNATYCTYFLIWWNTIMKWTDVDSFIALDHLYAKDKNNVYYACKSFSSADSKTFEVIPEKTPYPIRLDLQEDVNGSHYIYKINANYSKDKNQVFFLDKIVEGANPITFKSLGNGYAQDGDNYYFEWKPIRKDLVPKTIQN